MGTVDGDSEALDDLLMAAREAPAGTRIEYRDRIAHFGDRAIAVMEPWLRTDLGAFAVRVIERAAPYGTPLRAARALRAALPTVRSEAVVGDISVALGKLGEPPGHPRSRRSVAKAPSMPTMSPEDLVAGRVYRRRELHQHGLGGNRQTGISYPAAGTYVLLFSDPDARSEHGYIDRWSGNHYLYYGQWTGTGDMVFEVGNRAILDRATELYLFTAARGGFRFEGHFRCVRHAFERTTRDGREWTAIVFELEPAD